MKTASRKLLFSQNTKEMDQSFSYDLQLSGFSLSKERAEYFIFSRFTKHNSGEK